MRRVERIGRHSINSARRLSAASSKWLPRAPVDRLGRSLQDLVAFLNELHSKNANLSLHRRGIDTTTPGGKLLFQMLGVFAEFERSMIVEHVKAGLKREKAAGKVLDRPRVSAAIEAKVVALRKYRKLHGATHWWLSEGIEFLWTWQLLMMYRR